MNLSEVHEFNLYFYCNVRSQSELRVIKFTCWGSLGFSNFARLVRCIKAHENGIQLHDIVHVASILFPQVLDVG